MMTPEEQGRLAALTREWITRDEALDLVGVDAWDPSLEGMLLAYGRTLRQSKPPIRDDRVSRDLLEGLLQDYRLMSLPSAAFRLGMTESSFVDVLDALEKKGWALSNQGNPKGTV